MQLEMELTAQGVALANGLDHLTAPLRKLGLLHPKLFLNHAGVKANGSLLAGNVLAGREVTARQDLCAAFEAAIAELGERPAALPAGDYAVYSALEAMRVALSDPSVEALIKDGIGRATAEATRKASASLSPDTALVDYLKSAAAGAGGSSSGGGGGGGGSDASDT